MQSEARQKKIMEKLNRAQKCSILGPQNLGSRGAPGPRGPPPGSAPGQAECLALHSGKQMNKRETQINSNRHVHTLSTYHLLQSDFHQSRRNIKVILRFEVVHTATAMTEFSLLWCHQKIQNFY